MSDYLKLADAALAEFEARQKCEISELREISHPTQAAGKSTVSRIVLLAVPDGAPPEWFEGVRKVLVCPAPSFAEPEQWARVQDDCWRVLRDHGADASRLGWSTLDIFGCHPTRPLVRLDCMGLVLVLQGRPLLSLDAASAHIKSGGFTLAHRRQVCTSEAIPLWHICANGQQFDV